VATKKTYTALTFTSLALLLSGCSTPPPICDRSTQQWGKLGTQEDVCKVTKVVAYLPSSANWPDKKDKSPVTLAVQLYYQTTTPPAHTPTETPQTGSPDTPDEPSPDTPTSKAPDTPDEPTTDKPKGPQGNNGFGNGDQDAPGGSEGNNNAENAGVTRMVLVISREKERSNTYDYLKSN